MNQHPSKKFKGKVEVHKCLRVINIGHEVVNDEQILIKLLQRGQGRILSLCPQPYIAFSRRDSIWHYLIWVSRDWFFLHRQLNENRILRKHFTWIRFTLVLLWKWRLLFPNLLVKASRKKKGKRKAYPVVLILIFQRSFDDIFKRRQRKSLEENRPRE